MEKIQNNQSTDIFKSDKREAFEPCDKSVWIA